MDDMAEINREVLAGLTGGTAKPEELQAQIEKTWAELTADGGKREQIAEVLGVKPQALQDAKHAPVRFDTRAAGIGGIEAATIVLAWVGTEILLGAVKDLAKEELKKRLRTLWDKVLLPALKKKVSRDELGTEADL